MNGIYEATNSAIQALKDVRSWKEEYEASGGGADIEQALDQIDCLTSCVKRLLGVIKEEHWSLPNCDEIERVVSGIP